MFVPGSSKMKMKIGMGMGVQMVKDDAGVDCVFEQVSTWRHLIAVHNNQFITCQTMKMLLIRVQEQVHKWLFTLLRYDNFLCRLLSSTYWIKKEIFLLLAERHV